MPDTNLVSAPRWRHAEVAARSGTQPDLRPVCAWQGWTPFPSASNSTGVASVNYTSTQAYFTAASAAECCQACANSTDTSLVESASSADISAWNYAGCNVWTVRPPSSCAVASFWRCYAKQLCGSAVVWRCTGLLRRARCSPVQQCNSCLHACTG